MTSPIPKSRYRLWLQSLCEMLTGAEQGILVHQFQREKPAIFAKWPENKAAHKGLIKTAKTALEKQRMHLETAEEGGVYLGYPLWLDEQMWGTLVLHLTRHDSQAMQNHLKMIKWGLSWLRFIFLEDEAPRPIDNNGPGTDLHLLTLSLREATLDESAITLVNYLAAKGNCSRVSLALFKYERAKLLAVSSLTQVEARTQPMQTIAAAMEEALQQGENIHLAIPINTAPESKRLQHAKLIEQHKLTSAYTYLLRDKQHPVAALTFENTKQANIHSSLLALLNENGPYLATTFRLRSQFSGSVSALIKDKLKTYLSNLFDQKSKKEKTITAIVLVVIVFLIFPVPYNMSNKAVLESQNKHLLVSPFEGYTSRIYAKPGDNVTKGQLLAELNADTLKLERRKLTSELQQYRLEYDNALASGNRAQSAIINAQVEQAKIQLRLIEQKLSQTQLTSPLNGIIVSDDISQTVGAPVKQGDILFEVAAAGDYQVTIYIDERDIRDVSLGQEGKLSLTSLPGTHVAIKISRITPLSEIRDNRNYFRVDAEIIDHLEKLQPGMTGTAKLFVEKRAIGWILFHDIWHWIRLSFWI